MRSWPAVTGSTGRGDFSTRAQFLGRTLGAGALLALGDATGLITSNAEAARPRVSHHASVQHFYSRPDLRPPLIDVVQPSSGTNPGLLFLAPCFGPRPERAADRGRRRPGGLVQADDAADRDRLPHRAATTANPCSRGGRARGRDGLGVGEYVIADATYREIARFGAGNHRGEDQHEFLLTPQGTALITSWEKRTMNLQPIGGRSNATVDRRRGAGARDPERARAVRVAQPRPRRRRRVAPRRAGLRTTTSTSTRSTSRPTATCSSRPATRGPSTRSAARPAASSGGSAASGATSGWGADAAFAWQHDARLPRRRPASSASSTTRSAPVAPSSRARSCSSSTSGAARATLVREYSAPPGCSTRGRTGNAQLLADGGYLVGWGTEPYVTEYAADGTVRFDARLPHAGESYRAFRFPWVGLPAEPPTLDQRILDRTRVYASWNGATERARVAARGSGRRPTAPAGLVRPKIGFEAGFVLPRGGALRRRDRARRARRPLGSSAPFASDGAQSSSRRSSSRRDASKPSILQRRTRRPRPPRRPA